MKLLQVRITTSARLLTDYSDAHAATDGSFPAHELLPKSLWLVAPFLQDLDVAALDHGKRE